jgi:hypothetical protein
MGGCRPHSQVTHLALSRTILSRCGHRRPVPQREHLPGIWAMDLQRSQVHIQFPRMNLAFLRLAQQHLQAIF